MNKTNRFLPICLCGCISAICLGLGFGLTNLNQAQGAGANVTLNEFLAQEYVVGDTVSIPNYQFEKSGEKILAEKIVYLPSGQGYTGETLTFSEMGQYVLSYYAKKGEETFEKTETFQVSNNLYSTTGTKSQIGFGSVAEYTQYKANTRSGMIVDLSQGETLQYNKVINLNDYKDGETFLNMSMLPHSLGTADANKILVRLTDIYDSSNYITFECRKIGAGQNFMERLTYVMAYASNGQLPQGLAVKAQNKSDFVYEGIYYKRHLNDIYGTELYFPMSGYSITSGANIALDETKVGLQDMKLGFDYEEKRVYGNGALIVDFDDPALQTKIWNGFTTGECKLSVSVTGYNGSSCRMLFNEIDGNAIESNGKMYDDQKPEIFVDTAEISALEYIPVGKSVKLPSATARDSYKGNCEVTTQVFVNYGTNTQSLVDVADGAFTPKQERIYTIVYTAKDNCGNTQTKTYALQAKRTVGDISLSYGTVASNATLGQLVEIGKPTVANAIGNYYVTITAVKDGKEEELLSLNYDTLDGANYTWRPMTAGTYQIVYKYHDYVSQGETSYLLNVEANGQDVLIGDAVIPKYIIKGATYATPVFNGYEFVNGNGKAKKADLYVSTTADYAKSDKIVNDTFMVNANAQTCYFTFVLGENIRTYSVPIIDVNYGKSPLAMHKYFYGYSGEPVPEAENTTYTLANQSGEYSLEFINAVQAFDFSVGFTVPQTANYNKVKVVLTDSVDKTQQLVFNYRNTSATSYFSINGGVEYDFGKRINGASFELNYKNAKKTATVGVNMTYNIETGADGKEWEGFSSGKVWVQIFVEDITDTNAPQITMDKVNNQFIYKLVMMGMNLTEDIVEPQISTPTLRGNFAKGDKATIVPVEYGDVLDPNATATFTVKDPNGEVVVSSANVRLENLTDLSQSHEITLDVYGSYLISYLIKDAAGNLTAYEYGIAVVDEVAPAVSLNSHATAVYCGKAITLASLKIKDDISSPENCKIFKYVQTSDGQRVSVKGKSYTPAKAGEYQVWYYVYDEKGNVTIVGYTFTAV